MNYFNDKDSNLSLHSFRLVVESQYNKETENDYIKSQENMLSLSGINSDLNSIKTKEIRLKSNFLGERGWVISPFWIPSKNESWYDTWFWMAYHNSSESIADYYLENNYSLLENINGYSRNEVNRRDWFMEAENLFEMKMFTSCAMLLTAILEESIRKCPIDTWKQKITVFFNEAIKTKVEDYYINNRIEPLSRYIETILLLPSINAFINQYFKSGHRFGKDNEPHFLERNWLMHGMTNRTVTESDCVKLFNVICSLNYVIHTLFQSFYGQ
ncbi:hypothetical protein [Paenibacillus xylanexedens]|uniref:hypothetical protein n=1 Tax=Paenibacillus xylanexedens TaxID=528191 RepID=UPI00119D1BB5|nr:hypothetical protein [Paenibacillus xylanexedens]